MSMTPNLSLGQSNEERGENKFFLRRHRHVEFRIQAFRDRRLRGREREAGEKAVRGLDVEPRGKTQTGVKL